MPKVIFKLTNFFLLCSGYMAPEYAMLGHLSTKSDIYSFGIVILEIICGRKNTDVKLFPQFRSLLDRVRQIHFYLAYLL